MKKNIKNITIFIPLFFKAVIFFWEERKNLKKEGGRCISTDFIYKPVSVAEFKSFTFRTILQFDGDIINKYPDPDEFKDDNEWKDCYRENYLKHKKKIEDYISRFNGIYSIQWMISIITIWPPAFQYKDLLMPETNHVQSEIKLLCLYYLSIIVINMIFKKFVCKYIMRLIFCISRRWLLNLRKRRNVIA